MKNWKDMRKRKLFFFYQISEIKAFYLLQKYEKRKEKKMPDDWGLYLCGICEIAELFDETAVPCDH